MTRAKTSHAESADPLCFRITDETLRQFSLGEILLLIAMNIETRRLAAQDCA